MRSSVWIWVLLFGLLVAGCSDSSKEDLLNRAPAEGTGSGRPYEKPEGVSFHIPAILGLRYSSFKGSEKEVYLGTMIEETRLPGNRGRVYRYGEGKVYVARDIIYCVGYDFSRPVSKIEAIHRMGFPESIGAELRSTSTTLRVDHSSYGMRRLVLTRAAPNRDEFIRVEAWRFLPTERF